MGFSEVWLNREEQHFSVSYTTTCVQFQLGLASSSFRCLIQHLVVIWYLQM